MSNITSTDSFIFQRRGATGASIYLKTAAGQMSSFFRDVYSVELDTIIADVERIEQDFKDGDIVINNRIDAYADRVKIAAENVLPILKEDYWVYKRNIELMSSFVSDYDYCIRDQDGSLPIIDPPASEEDCLEKHALKYYQKILAAPEGELPKDSCFYVITSETPQYVNDVSHVCISNKPLDPLPGDQQSNLNGSIDWETEVVEGDILQISLVNQTNTGAILVDDEHYGMYTVVSVTNNPTGDGVEPFSLLKVNHIGGPKVGWVPVYRYQVKVMKSLGTTLGADFVQKSGDVMTGGLIIDAATTDNPRTFFNKGEAQTYDLTIGDLSQDGVLKTVGAGATRLSIESAALIVSTTDTQNSQLRINDAGVTSFLPVSYNSILSLTDPKHLPHKAYVDNADGILDNRIDQTNDRIDTISDVLEKQEYEMAFCKTPCWNEINTSDYDQWISCTKTTIIGDPDLSSEKVIYPKPIYAHLIDATGEEIPLEVDKINGLLVSSDSIGGLGIYDVDHEDIIELQLSTPGEEPQIIRYLAQQLDENDADYRGTMASKKVTVAGQEMYYINLNGGESNYLGDNQVQGGMNYVLKHFPKNQGISIDDADDRYLRQEGNNIIDGTLKVRNPVDSDNPVSAISIVDSDTTDVGLQIHSNGDLRHIGSGVSYNSPAGISSSASVEIDYQSININGQSASIKFGGEEKITIRATTTNFNNNELNGVITPAFAANDDVVPTLGWVKEHMISFFKAGSNISITQPLNSNLVEISHVSQRMIDMEDVVVPSNLTGGETLTYDAQTNQWVVRDLSELIRGYSSIADNEESTAVGGIWSDGTNFFIKVE